MISPFEVKSANIALLESSDAASGRQDISFMILFVTNELLIKMSSQQEEKLEVIYVQLVYNPG